MRFPSLFAALLIALIAIPARSADTVVLKNGDHLTGTAVKLEGGKLAFKTEYADAISIAWDQVVKLATAQPLMLPLAQKTLSVVALERSAQAITVATAAGPETLDASLVTVLRTPADQKAYEDSLHPGWGHGWAGTVSASLAVAQGNSQTVAFGTGLNMARATRTDKTSLYASTLYSRDNRASLTTGNTTDGGLRYDHNINPRLFAFGTGDFSSNALQNLDLRSIIGGGFGWHTLARPRQTLDAFGGLVWTHESYSPGATNSFAALNLGEQYSRKLGAVGQLSEQLTLYPDLQDASRFQSAFNSSFSTRIGRLFNWQTTFTDRYTSFPPAGTLKNDLVLTTGFGLSIARK